MIEFANLWLLCLLPVPFLVYVFLPKAAILPATALKVPFFAALQRISLAGKYKVRATALPILLALLIWILLVLAAAGPQWLGQAIELPRSGRDVMLAVDISGSMQIPDMEIQGQIVDRLTAVQYVASQFITARQGDRLGLILFGSKAYLQTPLTFDVTTVKNMLGDASIGLAGSETALGDAIGLAIKRLQNSDEQSRVIVLLTDGNNNSGVLDPRQAAKLAAQLGIRIYTIGIGGEAATLQTPFGMQLINPAADLDVATLQEIAQLTGGEFFRAKDTQALQAAYAQLDQLEPVESDKDIFRPIDPLYQWPLGVAFILSLLFILLKNRHKASISVAEQKQQEVMR
jgi:Ca-activated chloride channel homolog